MIKEKLQLEQINTDADASIKGIGLQKLRVAERLLRAIIDGKKAIFCTIEHIDDVLEIDVSKSKDVTDYVTEQDKSYSTNFSINDEEIKKSLRIFFDNWYGTVEGSENIKFLFYTNASIKKEKKVGILKEIDMDLPKKTLLQLIVEKKYSEAFPFVLPVFKKYYIEQHKKHTDKIETYEKILDSMDEKEWRKFFDLIEWNFERPNEQEIRNNINEMVKELCIKYNVSNKYTNAIIASILDMVESRRFADDFLEKIVHVSEIKTLFLEFAQEAKIEEKLDPMHTKWDGILCDDVRCLSEKFKNVCVEYDKEDLEDLEEEYVDGIYEQRQHPNVQQVKAYNYRVYKVCNKAIKKFLKKNQNNLKQDEIEKFLDDLTDEAYDFIKDKSKTYNVAYEDRDMIRKTIIILFQECYLALDERKSING